MQRRSRHSRGYAATVAVVAMLALGVTPAAFGDDWARDRAADAAMQQLDPAIQTAMVARTAEVTSTPAAAASVPIVDEDQFAWGAAVVGLVAGVAAMCALLGCVTLVRSHGRLRSV
jgi:hypothetical protein